MSVETSPKLGDAQSLSIECADCGHSRWRRPEEFFRFGFNAASSIERLSRVLTCSPCKSDGLPGKNVVVQVAFVTQNKQLKADAWALARSQKARAKG